MSGRLIGGPLVEIKKVGEVEGLTKVKNRRRRLPPVEGKSPLSP